MKKDTTNKTKKITRKVLKQFQELMLLLEGGDKRKHTTFDC